MVLRWAEGMMDGEWWRVDADKHTNGSKAWRSTKWTLSRWVMMKSRECWFVGTKAFENLTVRLAFYLWTELAKTKPIRHLCELIGVIFVFSRRSMNLSRVNDQGDLPPLPALGAGAKVELHHLFTTTANFENGWIGRWDELWFPIIPLSIIEK